ncbi:MAG: hypothetical protein EOP76_09585 [Variovorax sp.]|nr:MAG: hypothetical protein EOP76_09585 [Variovorax sp.]
MDEHRELTRKFALDGCTGCARAFNYLEEHQVPWSTSAAARSRFKALCGEMLRLLEKNELSDNPAHALHVRATEARADPAIQRLIRRASRKTLIRAR